MRDARVDLTLASSGGRAPFLTYEPYYGLKEKPFSLSSDPRFLYKSRAHASVYDDLKAGIRRREGLVVLTGDIGTGKTTLCRSVLKDLDRKTFSTFVPDPFVSREDLLKMLLIDFGVMSVDDLKSGRLNGASRPDLSYPLYEFLRTLVPLQAFAVLVIDEAQNLSLPLLEEIRILSDLEGPEKLLQVVMIGQLEFLPKLKDPQMRQFDQRVSVRCRLQTLDRDALAGYIAHRLGIAGGGTDRVNFSEDAIDVLFRATSGNPRLINLICDKSLHHGHLARVFSIGPDIVNQALGELGVTQLTPSVTPQPAPAPARPAPRAVAPPPAASDQALTRLLLLPAAPEPTGEGTSLLQEETLSESMSAFKVESEYLQADLDEGLAAPRTWVRWLVAALVVTGIGTSLFFGWQLQQAELYRNVSMAPPPAVPADPFLTAVPLPMPPAALIVPTASAPATAVFVGVAQFSTPARAARLEAELMASGHPALTRTLEFNAGLLYEVRTGPYDTRDAAEVAVGRIREMPGLQDARVLLPAPTPAPAPQ